MASTEPWQAGGTSSSAVLGPGRRDTRDRFLNAALAVFGRLGYRDSTVKDILQEAGGGRATFYTYFSGKSDVAAQLFEGCLPGAQAFYAELADATEITREYVRGKMEKGLGFWSRNRCIMEALNAAMTDDPAIAERHYQWNVEAVEALTRNWERSRLAEGRLRAILLVLQWERFCYHWLIQGVPQDRDLVLDVLTDIWYAELTALRAGGGPSAGAPVTVDSSAGAAGAVTGGAG